MTTEELNTYHALLEVDSMLGTNKSDEYLKNIEEKTKGKTGTLKYSVNGVDYLVEFDRKKQMPIFHIVKKSKEE